MGDAMANLFYDQIEVIANYGVNWSKEEDKKLLDAVKTEDPDIIIQVLYSLNRSPLNALRRKHLNKSGYFMFYDIQKFENNFYTKGDKLILGHSIITKMQAEFKTIVEGRPSSLSQATLDFSRSIIPLDIGMLCIKYRVSRQSLVKELKRKKLITKVGQTYYKLDDTMMFNPYSSNLEE